MWFRSEGATRRWHEAPISSGHSIRTPFTAPWPPPPASLLFTGRLVLFTSLASVVPKPPCFSPHPHVCPPAVFLSQLCDSASPLFSLSSQHHPCLRGLLFLTWLPFHLNNQRPKKKKNKKLVSKAQTLHWVSDCTRHWANLQLEL